MNRKGAIRPLSRGDRRKTEKPFIASNAIANGFHMICPFTFVEIPVRNFSWKFKVAAEPGGFNLQLSTWNIL